MIEHPLSIIAEGQMKAKIRYPYIARSIVVLMLKAGVQLRYISLVSRMFAKLRRVFK